MEAILSSVIPFLLILMIIVLPALIIAKKLEKKRKSEFPEQQPFTWGYYFGVNFILVGILCSLYILIATFVHIIDGTRDNIILSLLSSFLISALLLFLFTYSGLNVIKRKKWAWILLTIFAGNFIVWIINYTYGKRRWNEFE